MNPCKKYDAIQFADGLYHRASLLDPKTGEPSQAYTSIVQEIKQAGQARGVAEHEMGLPFKRVGKKEGIGGNTPGVFSA